MEVDYYSKYLKYKAKYLELKAQLGSSSTNGSKIGKTTRKKQKVNIPCHGRIRDMGGNYFCSCKNFTTNKITPTVKCLI
jgi:hypothetical protein